MRNQIILDELMKEGSTSQLLHLQVEIPLRLTATILHASQNGVSAWFNTLKCLSNNFP